jgi:hypothetical protein
VVIEPAAEKRQRVQGVPDYQNTNTHEKKGCARRHRREQRGDHHASENDPLLRPNYLTEKRLDCQFPGTELSGQRSLERGFNLTHLSARNNPRALPPNSRLLTPGSSLIHSAQFVLVAAIR